MFLICPSCERKLMDTADRQDPPLFCMYCGQKLQSTTSNAAHLEETIDAPTASYDVTHTFGDVEAVSNLDATQEVVGGYRLLRFLGAGGMGAVYEGEHEASGQKVAVKVLSGRVASNPVIVERFRQEGRVASQISHPRCVYVLRADADVDAGRPYIVMELMPGETLKDLVDEHGPLSATDAIVRILDVIDGLAEAHRLGVIHRDVKPSNCFLSANDRVKVGDFGLAKSLIATDDDKQLTGTGAFLGTVLFASPEQIRGEPVGYDSDVYAVCATLYYLLTHRAPFQQESMTAAVAKAVSEPAPPVRQFRPDVSRELERVILRGLERNRERRWQSLQDLGDVLREMLPSAQQPAKLRTILLAFMVDALLLQLLLVPVEVLSQFFPTFNRVIESAFGTSWLDNLLVVAYFALFEGWMGATPGKQLLRLRVSRIDQTIPPGFSRGMARTLIFFIVLLVMFQLPDLFVRIWPGGTLGGMIGLGAFFLGLVVLAYQIRKGPRGHQGIHDLLTGCHVVQRRHMSSRRRLTSQFPDPLERIQPTHEPFSKTLGGFYVEGKIHDLPDGGEVWTAHDKALGRRILLRILPAGFGDPSGLVTAIHRPTRLRVLSHGCVNWRGSERGWISYAAPVGSPLLDVVSPANLLTWAETRPLLEQLLEELESASLDGTGIWRPGLNQVWVEPGGRLQLLEFPLPAGSDPVPHREEAKTYDDVHFIRQVATMALEGRPRSDSTPPKAPLPRHASEILNRLFLEGEHDPELLSTMRCELTASHDSPATVTAGMRAAHLGVQATILAPGLLVMLLVSGMATLVMSILVAQSYNATDSLRHLLEDPAAVQRLRARIEAESAQGTLRPETTAQLNRWLAPDEIANTCENVRRLQMIRESDRNRIVQHLNRPEQIVFSRYQQALNYTSNDADDLNLWVASNQLTVAERATTRFLPTRIDLLLPLVLVIVIWPIGWAILALIVRRGLSKKLAGIVLVEADGRLARRWKCAVRELMVWTPFALMLIASLWIQLAAPEYILLRSVFWLMGVLMLPLYIMIALRYPSQPPQDRLLGTHLVPE